MGNKFVAAPDIPVLSSPPADPEEGQVYFDTALGQLRIYRSNSWLDLGPSSGDGGGGGPAGPPMDIPGLPRPGPLSGDANLVIPFALASVTLATLASTSNQARFIPFGVRAPIRITRVDINVSTSGAGTAQVGIYSSSATYPYSPASLSYVVTGLDTGTTGTRSSTGLTWDLQPGLYWLAIWTSGTPTLRAVPVNDLYPLTANIAGNNVLNSHYTVSNLTSGLPSTAPTTFTASNSAFPAIAILYSLL